MKQTLLTLLLISIGLISEVQGQRPSQNRYSGEGISIKGRLIDIEGTPIPFASILIYRGTDSSRTRGTTSDGSGAFSIRVRPGGIYTLSISFLSFKDHIIRNIEVEKNDVDLGDITLITDAEKLEGVTVEGERPMMELKMDKRIFHIDKDMTNVARNALEILDNIPSVTVDVDGNVALRGSGNVRILVDGKESSMIGIGGTDGLRTLQGSMIASIEVITNPSARYEAEGEVGIINIVLKKEKNEGANGTFDANVGYPDNYGGGFNMNFRKKKVNLFASYHLNYRKNPGSGHSKQIFTYPDTSFSYVRDRTHSRSRLSNNFRLGSDFYLNDHNSITFSAFYMVSEGKNDAQLTYQDYNENGELTQIVIRTEDEDEKKNNIDFALNYTKTFDKKDQKWTVDFQWMNNDDVEKADLFETSDDPMIPDITQRADNTENQENFLFQTDYIQPLGKNGKFESGLRANWRTVSSDYMVEELGSDGEWYVIPLLDNEMVYDENIYALYVMAGDKRGNFSYQAGLRSEYSDIKTNLLKTEEVNHRTYLDFFPSLHLTYDLKGENYLQLSYSRRIKRPRFRHLLPFFSYSDSRNYYSGNPNLDPEYTHSTELGYLKYWEKGSLLSSVYYRYSTGVFDWISISDSAGLIRTFPVNIGERNSFGLELIGSWKPAKWWDINANINFFRSIVEGEYDGKIFDADAFGWTGRLTTRWNVNRKFNAQVAFNYRSPREDTQGENFASYSLDAAVSLDILKGNGTLTLNARDLLNTRKRRYIIYEETFVTEGSFQWRSRSVVLSFNYRLNQKKKRGRNGGRNGEFEDMEIGM